MKNYKDIIEFFKTLPGLDVTPFVTPLNTLTTDFQGAIIYFKSCSLTQAIVYKDKVLCNEVVPDGTDPIHLTHDNDNVYTYDEPDLLKKLEELYKRSSYNIKQMQIKVKKESLNTDFTIENQSE